jgi:hypothetical protein
MRNEKYDERLTALLVQRKKTKTRAEQKSDARKTNEKQETQTRNKSVIAVCACM